MPSLDPNFATQLSMLLHLIQRYLYVLPTRACVGGKVKEFSFT